MGKRRGVYKVWGGRGRRKESLGRPRHRGKDNIRMDPNGTYWEGVGCIDLTQVRGNLREVLKQ